MTKKSVLINPITSRDLNDSHRSATPLELFYDLIYVVAIASLAAELHHALSAWHHVGHAIGLFAFIFWAIWWPWNSYTWFASGYDTDDAQFRLASFAQMIGVIIIAVGVKPAFTSGNFMIMMIGYVTMRVPYVLMWLKIAYDDVQSRPVAIRYAGGVTLLQAAWTIGIIFFPSWPLFIALMILEIILPYIAESQVDKGQNSRYHYHHIEERLGLLLIIVLGESILASVAVFGKVFDHFTPDLLMLVIGSTMTLFSMWWLYFDDELDQELRHEKKAFIWGYGHYFVYLSATAVGALIAVQLDVVTGHAEISAYHAGIGMSLAISAYLASIWLCHDMLLEKTGIKKYELLMLAALVLLLSQVPHSILWIGLSFAALNAIRLARKHKAFINEHGSD